MMFTPNEWAVVLLVFLLGLFIGMFFLAGGKWKRRYRDEVARREELERDNEALRKELRDLETLRGAAARAPGRPIDAVDRERGPL